MTMFEVGKLSDETLDSFLAELEKVRLSVDTKKIKINLCLLNPQNIRGHKTNVEYNLELDVEMLTALYLDLFSGFSIFRWRAQQRARPSVTLTTL